MEQRGELSPAFWGVYISSESTTTKLWLCTQEINVAHLLKCLCPALQQPALTQQALGMAVLRRLLSKGVALPLLQGEGALGPDFVVQWINQHAIASAALGKPLIVEEFGVAVNSSSDSGDMSSRTAIYQTAYMALNSSITSSTAGADSILRGERVCSPCLHISARLCASLCVAWHSLP